MNEAPPRLDVLHVDMDCFFAAVEVLDDPSLKGRPVVVGGTGRRGVVASCSYEARATGVRSAMPIGEARRRCPQAAFVAGRHGRYSEVSEQLHAVFSEFTPVVEPIGLDEAFLDVSGGHRLLGSSEEIARAIRSRVKEALLLECSVGVGRTKQIAKLASREAKPRATKKGPLPGRGVVVVHPEEEREFLWHRPVRDLWGVGPKSAAQLTRYGITTVAELASVEQEVLERLLGKALGRHLHLLAWGRDERPVQGGSETKSISHEETFSFDRHSHEELRAEVVRLSDSVGHRLRKAGLTGRTVNIKLRFGDFTMLTRAHSLEGPLLSSSEIAHIANALLEAIDVGPGVRLLGVAVSSLEPLETAGGRQLSLLSLEDLGEKGEDSKSQRAPEPKRAEVEAAIDAIRARYGLGAVGPAAVVEEGGRLRVKELGDKQWG
jgi:DNA polymerase-4